MWSKLGAFGVLAYFSYTISKLYELTSPPICEELSEGCLAPATTADDHFIVKIFFSTEPVKKFSGGGGPFMAPVVSDQKNLRVGGQIMSSIANESDCRVWSKNWNVSESESASSLVKTLAFAGLTKVPCVKSIQFTVPEEWRTNATTLYLTTIATLQRGTGELAFLPSSEVVSIMYNPDKKLKTKKRFLYPTISKAIVRFNNRALRLPFIPKQLKAPQPLFGGEQYAAVPRKIQVGPYRMVNNLEAAQLKWGWGVSQGKYKSTLKIDTLVSPRDTYFSLPIGDPDDERFQEAPTISIELASSTWRKAAITDIMSNSIRNSEKQFGTSQYDSDSMRLLLASESPTILLVTFVVSVLHMVFEFLAMGSTYSHFQDTVANPSLCQNLSRRAIAIDTVMEVFICAWLHDEGEATIVQILLVCKILFNVWRFIKLRRVQKESHQRKSERTVEQSEESRKEKNEKDDLEEKSSAQKKSNFWEILPHRKLSRARQVSANSDEFEKFCVKNAIGIILFPSLLLIAFVQLYLRPHASLSSCLLKIGAHTAYVGGFVALLPQLFKNYYFRSVEALSWAGLTYQFLNTIIDDLFSFLIRMPKAHRISVFRDDVVFVVYWLQKRHYRKGSEDNSKKNKLKEQ